MDANRIDAIAKLFADRRLSRRAAVRQGGDGLAAAGLIAAGLAAHTRDAAAQDATARGSPGALDIAAPGRSLPGRPGPGTPPRWGAVFRAGALRPSFERNFFFVHNLAASDRLVTGMIEFSDSTSCPQPRSGCPQTPTP